MYFIVKPLRAGGNSLSTVNIKEVSTCGFFMVHGGVTSVSELPRGAIVTFGSIFDAVNRWMDLKLRDIRRACSCVCQKIFEHGWSVKLRILFLHFKDRK